MATKKVLVNLDFGGNQIINVRAEVAASAPTGTVGRFYFNTTSQKLFIYTTSGWEQVGADLPENIVTGTGLTAGKVIVGGGDSTIAASSFTIAKSVPSDAEFTDRYVAQSPASSTSREYPVVFAGKEWSGGGFVDGVQIDQQITYNPNGGRLSAKELVAQAVTINGQEAATVDYVDAQDQKLDDRISSISGFGRYLSGWDMATGKPTSKPLSSTYLLKTGDYFVISNVPASGTKYKPNQTGTWVTSQAFAKEATDVDCAVGGYWKYDGSTWSYFAPEQVVSLPSFTNTTKGAIKGHQANGCVYHNDVDGEGIGRVFGWDSKADNNNSHTISISGDVVAASGSHTNENNSNASITVTIGNGKVTSVKIADGAVGTAKIANDAVDHTKIKAKSTLVGIMGSQSSTSPYWQATGNANEYKSTISNVTLNGTVRLCEYNSTAGTCKEVECFYEYATDSSGVISCTAYINAATIPSNNTYCFLCRKE